MSKTLRSVSNTERPAKAEKPLVKPDTYVPIDQLGDGDLLTLDEVGRYLKNMTARRVREKFINTGRLAVVELSPRVKRVTVRALRVLIAELSTDEPDEESTASSSRRPRKRAS